MQRMSRVLLFAAEPHTYLVVPTIDESLIEVHVEMLFVVRVFLSRQVVPPTHLLYQGFASLLLHPERLFSVQGLGAQGSLRPLGFSRVERLYSLKGLHWAR